MNGLYPEPTTPTIFADTVLNVARRNHVVKFYLARLDPDGNVSDNSSQTQIAAQVIMSTSTFVETAIFFSQALEEMVRAGVVTQDEIERVRSAQKTD